MQPHKILAIVNSLFTRILGLKQYEVVDHLQNVRAVISDVKESTIVSGIPQDFEPDILTTKNLYPGGLEHPNRHFGSPNTRYSFNGKEDVKEWGNGIQDFDSRFYSKHLNRWLSGDPRERDYPAISPFVFALNSPMMFKDPNGEDAIVAVQKDPNGGGKIIISSTIYITGKGASPEMLAGIRDAASKILINKTVNIKNKKGQEEAWTVEFDVKFEYSKDTPEFAIVNSENVGENVLEVYDYPAITGVGSRTTTTTDEDGSSTTTFFTGDYGQVGSQSKDISSAFVHETLHFLGLSDRYRKRAYEGTNRTGQRPDDDFRGKIMGSGKYIAPISLINYVNLVETFSNKESGKYLLDKRVDVDPNNGKLIGGKIAGKKNEGKKHEKNFKKIE